MKCRPALFITQHRHAKHYICQKEMSMRYTPDGRQLGVTVLSILPATEAGSRTKEKHGYEANNSKFKCQNLKL